MGGILHRSAARRDDEKTKNKKDRRKRQREEKPDLDVGFNQNNSPATNINENQDPNLDFVKSYDLWNSDYDNKFTMNINGKDNVLKNAVQYRFFCHKIHLVHHVVILQVRMRWFFNSGHLLST